MSAIFESTIKMAQDSKEDWYIELKDSVEGDIEICADLQEYSKKIEELGAPYGGDIEVKWSKDMNVPPYVMDTIRFEMSKLQREIEDETGESIIKDKVN